MLNDDTRGATMEAVVSRMKTVESALARSARESQTDYAGIRFMAISATVPNVQDVSLCIIQNKLRKPAQNKVSIVHKLFIVYSRSSFLL